MYLLQSSSSRLFLLSLSQVLLCYVSSSFLFRFQFSPVKSCYVHALVLQCFQLTFLVIHHQSFYVSASVLFNHATSLSPSYSPHDLLLQYFCSFSHGKWLLSTLRSCYVSASAASLFSSILSDYATFLFIFSYADLLIYVIIQSSSMMLFCFSVTAISYYVSTSCPL